MFDKLGHLACHLMNHNRCQRDVVTLVTCLVGASPDVTVMMSESRQQNTEVRLAVGSIADKVDRLTEKVRCRKYLTEIP